MNRTPCFVEDADRTLYLNLLNAYLRRHRCAVHAYVLMSNHVHMLVTPSDEDGLSAMMKALGERYVPYFNKAHGRTGTLWDGRFKSFPVQSERYFFTCHRYIELNPVRAGMVDHPARYAWSSYATNALGAASQLITPHELYASLGVDPVARAVAYRRLFAPPTDDELRSIRKAITTGNMLATEAFANALERQTGLQMAPRKRGRPANENEAENVPPRGKLESVPI